MLLSVSGPPRASGILWSSVGAPGCGTTRTMLTGRQHKRHTNPSRSATSARLYGPWSTPHLLARCLRLCCLPRSRTSLAIHVSHRDGAMPLRSRSHEHDTPHLRHAYCTTVPMLATCSAPHALGEPVPAGDQPSHCGQWPGSLEIVAPLRARGARLMVGRAHVVLVRHQVRAELHRDDVVHAVRPAVPADDAHVRIAQHLGARAPRRPGRPAHHGSSIRGSTLGHPRILG
jgi:hypothetical protein